jgi:PhzF family phenazine biosynthesis protein
MSLPLIQVDAFTSAPFKGNPAGVCFLSDPRPDVWMAAVAAEMNLSETAFLLPEGDGYRLRWFTPVTEVSLCGHATLGSAHALWETGRLSPQQEACFYTLSGLLTARCCEGWIELNFPARPVESVAAPEGLLEALGIDALPVFTGLSKTSFLVEVESESLVREIVPDFVRLKEVPVRAVIVTCRAPEGEFDFISRFFAPRMGINEDPVTGSAHCALTPYWASKLGRTEMTAYQASRRGGVVRVRNEGDRVMIGGQAVTVIRGELVE